MVVITWLREWNYLDHCAFSDCLYQDTGSHTQYSQYKPLVCPCLGQQELELGMQESTDLTLLQGSPLGVSYENLKEKGVGGELGQSKRAMEEKILHHEWNLSFRNARENEDWEYLLDLQQRRSHGTILGSDLGRVSWNVDVKWGTFVENMELRKEGLE